MLEYLRSLPPGYFILANPIGWLFLGLPGVVFYLRYWLHVPRSVSTATFLCISLGWILIVTWTFTSDRLMWLLVDERQNLPPPHWRDFLFHDGARDVFAVLFGWIPAALALLAWSPVLLLVPYVRKSGKSD